MHGLMNRALQDLIVDRYGRQRWEAIRRKADVPVEVFVGMNSTSPEIALRLVASASEALETPPERLLEEFGEHWILYSTREGYGELVELAGRSVIEILQNLDRIQAHVGLTFPKAQWPSLQCSDVGPSSLRLHCRCLRDGLAPIVVGLLKGLGKRFGTPVEVVHDRRLAAGHDHDEFIVRVRPAA